MWHKDERKLGHKIYILLWYQKLLKLISLNLVIKEVPQVVLQWIYFNLNMRRFFRNILKNVWFALRHHFATADNIHVIFFYIWINIKDEIELHDKTLLKAWTLIAHT